MDEDDRDLPRLIRVEHVQPRQLLQPLGVEQADLLEDRQGAPGEMVRQGRGQVPRERFDPARIPDPAVAQRIVQFQAELGPGAGAGVLRRDDPQECRDRVDLTGHQEFLLALAFLEVLELEFLDGHEGHAHPLGSHPPDLPLDLVIGGEEELVELFGRPDGGVPADGDPDALRGEPLPPRVVQPHPPPGRDPEEPREGVVVDRPGLLEARVGLPGPDLGECGHRRRGPGHGVEVVGDGQFLRCRLGPAAGAVALLGEADQGGWIGRSRVPQVGRGGGAGGRRRNEGARPDVWRPAPDLRDGHALAAERDHADEGDREEPLPWLAHSVPHAPILWGSDPARGGSPRPRPHRQSEINHRGIAPHSASIPGTARHGSTAAGPGNCRRGDSGLRGRLTSA